MVSEKERANNVIAKYFVRDLPLASVSSSLGYNDAASEPLPGVPGLGRLGVAAPAQVVGLAVQH